VNHPEIQLKNGSNVPESNCFAYLSQHGGQLVAHPIFAFRFYSPVRRLDQPQGSGDLGEHCSSPAVGRGVCASPGRVAQPRLLVADRGHRAAAANRGRFLLVTFLGKTRKVTSCRATPGGVDFDSVYITERQPLRGDPSTGSGRTAI